MGFAPVITVVQEPSIVKRGQAIFRINGNEFMLSTDNLNYFDFLRPEFIQTIKLVSNGIVCIELDRHKIRHCARRYIMVNLKSKRITWYNKAVTPEYAFMDMEDILPMSKMELEVFKVSSGSLYVYLSCPPCPTTLPYSKS